jgi:hypothetical protein
LRQKLLETYPGFEPYIEEIMPKKASLEAVKLYALPPSPNQSPFSKPHPSNPHQQFLPILTTYLKNHFPIFADNPN